MRLSKDLDGKAIISVSDGRYVGKAKDVYVDRDLRSIIGLFLGSEGLISRKAQIIRREDVVLFGIDAILVRDSDIITDDKTVEEVAAWLRRDKLEGREIHTPGGTRLGSVGDVILDETGQITGFALGRVFVEGPLAEQGMVPREAVLETEGPEGRMLVDLARLEALYAQQEEVQEPSVEVVETEVETEEATVEVEAETPPEEPVEIIELDEPQES